MIRKNEKSQLTEDIISSIYIPANEICTIYNETPIRQNRAFKHYSMTEEQVFDHLSKSNGIFICIYDNGKIVGFAELLASSNTLLISQILSLTTYRNKAINNGIINNIVKFATKQGYQHIIYARFGNHPTLDQFKRNNGFKPYFVPGKSRLTDYIPESFKKFLIPIFNWFSRQKIRVKYKLKGNPVKNS